MRSNIISYILIIYRHFDVTVLMTISYLYFLSSKLEVVEINAIALEKNFYLWKIIFYFYKKFLEYNENFLSSTIVEFNIRALSFIISRNMVTSNWI